MIFKILRTIVIFGVSVLTIAAVIREDWPCAIFQLLLLDSLIYTKDIEIGNKR